MQINSILLHRNTYWTELLMLNNVTICVQINDLYWIELLMLVRNTAKHSTGFKQTSCNESFKNRVTHKLFAYKSYAYTHTHTHIYIYIYIYISSSSVDSVYFPDTLSLSIPIIHRSRQVLWAASCVWAKLIYIYIYTHTHTHIYIHTHTNTHTYICMYIYIYTHTHTYIYIYT